MTSPFSTQSAALSYNAKNAVTQSIERTTFEGLAAVRKVLTRENQADTPLEWRASLDPEHWNFWQREALVYRSDLAKALSGSGVRLPKLLQIKEDGHRIEIFLEDIGGRSGNRLLEKDYAHIAFTWGCAQATLANAQWTSPWMSRRFLREYTDSKPVDYQLLFDTAAWQQPLIANNWSQSLQDQLIALYENRFELCRIVNSAECAPCHLDFWPNNLFVDTQNFVVPIDWAFFGEGALGEDIANFIPDAVFDDCMAPELLPSIEKNMFDAYVLGLKKGGLVPDVSILRKTFYACAVKYVWLAPLLLKNAESGAMSAYGGKKLHDADRQYRHRGIALETLCKWANAALEA